MDWSIRKWQAALSKWCHFRFVSIWTCHEIIQLLLLLQVYRAPKQNDGKFWQFIFPFFLVKENHKKKIEFIFPFFLVKTTKLKVELGQAELIGLHLIMQKSPSQSALLLQLPWPKHKATTHSFNTALHLAASSVGTGTKLPPQPTQWSPPYSFHYQTGNDLLTGLFVPSCSFHCWNRDAK